MNKFQRKQVERLIDKANDRIIELKDGERQFLEDILTEDKMTDGRFELTAKQNSWLNKIQNRL